MSGAAVSPTDYVIRTRFDVGAVPGLGAVSTQIGRLDQRISGLGSTLTNKLVAGFAAVASAQGLASLTRQVVGLHTEIESAQFGIASLFSAINKAPMTDALEVARGTLQGLREDAAKGVGELQDYATTFQQIYGLAASRGADLQTVRELTRLTIAMGAATGRPGSSGFRLASIDVVQGLSAGASVKTEALNNALMAAGISKAQFNAADGQKRLELLTKGLRTYEASASAYAATWDARSSTFRDNIKEIARTATQPLFVSWSAGLARANEWLQKNKALIDQIATKASTALLSGQGALMQNAGSIGTTGAAGIAGAIGLRGAAGAAGAMGVGGGIGAMAASAVGAALAAITFSMASAIKRWPELGRTMRDELGKLGVAIVGFGSAVVKLGDNPFVQEFGSKFVTMVNWIIWGATKIVELSTWAVEKFNTLSGMTWGDALAATGKILAHEQKFLPNPVLAANPALPYSGMSGGAFGAFKAGLQSDFLKPKKDPELQKPPTIKIDKIEIKIEAERLDDPNTVARTFEQAMSKIMNHPRTARGGRLVPKPL